MKSRIVRQTSFRSDERKVLVMGIDGLLELLTKETIFVTARDLPMLTISIQAYS
jgi:hypothetical protein